MSHNILGIQWGHQPAHTTYHEHTNKQLYVVNTPWRWAAWRELAEGAQSRLYTRTRPTLGQLTQGRSRPRVVQGVAHRPWNVCQSTTNLSLANTIMTTVFQRKTFIFFLNKLKMHVFCENKNFVKLILNGLF